MDSKLLKKLIKLAENVGHLYYQAYREQQGPRNTPRRPYMKAMDGFTAEEASVLVCPGCELRSSTNGREGRTRPSAKDAGRPLTGRRNPKARRQNNEKIQNILLFRRREA